MIDFDKAYGLMWEYEQAGDGGKFFVGPRDASLGGEVVTVATVTFEEDAQYLCALQNGYLRAVELVKQMEGAK
jgi:hypothetical protein